MKPKVIIQPLNIIRKGEIKSFQVKMPSDAKRITGIVCDVKGLDILLAVEVSAGGGVSDGFPSGINLRMQDTISAGELKLQSCESANIFYAKEVKMSDNNLGYGDFSLTDDWWGFPYGYQWEPDEVMVEENCPVINGTYRDLLGSRLGNDLAYQVNLYLWYSTE